MSFRNIFRIGPYFLSVRLVFGRQKKPLRRIRPWQAGESYGYGDLVRFRGKILRCDIPGHIYAESWDPQTYPLAWKEVKVR